MIVRHIVAVTSVQGLIQPLQQPQLIVKLISFILILLISRGIQLRYPLIELIQIPLIRLASCRGRRAGGIPSGETGGIAHSVLHRLLSLTGILILVLLIQRIRIHVIGKIGTVGHFVQQLLYLLAVRAFICLFLYAVCHFRSSLIGVPGTIRLVL